MVQKIYFRNVIALVLVLPNVFIVSYGIAKCIREITRGSIMGRYFMTNVKVFFLGFKKRAYYFSLNNFSRFF